MITKMLRDKLYEGMLHLNVSKIHSSIASMVAISWVWFYFVQRLLHQKCCETCWEPATSYNAISPTTWVARQVPLQVAKFDSTYFRIILRVLSNDNFTINLHCRSQWKMLTRVGFELAPSGYRSAALPVELSSPQGLEASFIKFKCTRYILCT